MLLVHKPHTDPACVLRVLNTAQDLPLLLAGDQGLAGAGPAGGLADRGTIPTDTLTGGRLTIGVST